MCVDGDILDSRIKRIMKQIYFSYFWYGFRIKTSVYAWTCDEQPRTCDEQPRTCEEHIRTIKNIQTYSRRFK